MKIQVNVDEQLWRKAKVSALERGVTLGELVGVALGNLILLVADKKSAVPVAELKTGGVVDAQAPRGRTGGSTPPTAANPERKRFNPNVAWQLCGECATASDKCQNVGGWPVCESCRKAKV